MTLLLLIAAAFAAGAINSVAGGGSFLTFPSLIFSGVSPVMANASSTVALVPGTVASILAYRADVQKLDEKYLKLWLVVSLLGGRVAVADYVRQNVPANCALAAAVCHAIVYVRQSGERGAGRPAARQPVVDAGAAVSDCVVRRLFRRRDRHHVPGGAAAVWND